MFGRRRHAAAEVQAAPVPQLTDAQILEVVHTKIAEPAPVADWTRVNDGKITMVRVVFDARPFTPPSGH